MRPGWNPVRRNRNLGTGAQGHGQDNELVIPESRHDSKRYFERLTSCVSVLRHTGKREVRFLVEPPTEGWFYPCTPDDVWKVMRHCPEVDLETVDLILFRQPTRKQTVLSPVWGRALWYAELRRWNGSAIVLEAQNLEPLCWEKSVTPALGRELRRLENDGHRIVATKREIRIEVTEDSLRHTLLYRTLLHELGHQVDYGSNTITEWRRRTQMEKEDFAHRYAARVFATLKRRGLVPFPKSFVHGS